MSGNTQCKMCAPKNYSSLNTPFYISPNQNYEWDSDALNRKWLKKQSEAVCPPITTLVRWGKNVEIWNWFKNE